MRSRIYALMVLLCVCISIDAQKRTNVLLEKCDLLTFNKEQGSSYQVLKGNVRFRHENTVMYCDSAYFYDQANSFDAFGHIRIVQQDGSASMTAEKMFYDGNTSLMRVRGNVVASNQGTSLYTDNLDYFREKEYGYYFGGGRVVENEYTLTSKTGYYYPSVRSYFFKDDVVLTHVEYTITSDSLQYNSESGNVRLVGPSVIKGKDYTILTTNGTTNTQTHINWLYDYSVVQTERGATMTADTIYYDSNIGIVRAYHQAEVRDTVQKMIMRGDYAEYYQQYPSNGLLTGDPYVIDFSQGDSLFLRADTMRYVVKDSLCKEMWAYNRVCFYRSDFQGRCDSMVYQFADSIAYMYNDPILWMENNQLTGEVVSIHLRDESPDWLLIDKKAMIVSKEEAEGEFNQLSGRQSKAFIRDNELYRVDMMGDAESIFYSEDERGALVGINKAKGSLMQIYLNSRQLDHIVMTPDSHGTMYPPNKMPKDEMFLRNFSWREELRPLTKSDIFKK